MIMEQPVNLNCSYIKAKPGIFKDISVALGLLAMAFTAAAYDKEKYHAKMETNDGSWSSIEESCEDLNKHLADPKPCPNSWFVIVSLVIIIFSWLATFIMFVVFLVVDLNRKGLGKVDFYLQMGAGVLFFVAAIINLAFIIFMFSSNFSPENCKEIVLKRQKEWDDGIKLFKRNTTGSYVRQSRQESDEAQCNEYFNELFQPVLLIIGLLCTIPAGVVYIIAAIMVKGQQGQAPTGRVAPMMMSTGQPFMAPTQIEVPPPAPGGNLPPAPGE